MEYLPDVAAASRELFLNQVLQRLGTLLTASLSLDELFADIFDLLAEVVPYDSVSVQLINGSGRLELVAGRGFDDLARVRELVGELSPYAKIDHAKRRVLVIPNTHADPRWIVHTETAYIRSWIGVSLQVKGQPIGILNVDCALVGTYDETDAAMVAAFANQAAVAIENTRLAQAVQERADWLRVLHEVAVATAAVVDVDTLLQQATEHVVASLSYDYFGFLLADTSTKLLYPHPSFHGVAAPFLEQTIPFRGHVGDQGVNGREVLIVDEWPSDRACHLFLRDACSAIIVSLRVGGEFIGLVVALSKQPHHFTDKDARFLTTLGSHLAGAIVRVQKYSGLYKDAAQLSLRVEEQQLRLATETGRLAAILEHAGEAIFFASPTGVLLYVNRAALALTGCAAETMLGQTVTEALAGMAEATCTNLVTAISQGEGWRGNASGQRVDGSRYETRLTLVPLHDRQGQLEGFVGVLADIGSLREFERLKAELVANVSHEFRTPLATLKTYIRLLQMGKEERREGYLKVLEGETERLEGLVQDLLEISQVGAEQLELQPLALERLASEVISHYQGRVARNHIKLYNHLHASLPLVLGDERQLYRALSNLLNNALVYTPAQGAITISARQDRRDEEPMLCLQITDSGPGVPTEDLPHIFDRFYRGHTRAQHDTAGGLGLGLAVTHEIVQRHRGSIEVANEPGGGATFKLWLRVAEQF